MSNLAYDLEDDVEDEGDFYDDLQARAQRKKEWQLIQGGAGDDDIDDYSPADDYEDTSALSASEIAAKSELLKEKAAQVRNNSGNKADDDGDSIKNSVTKPGRKSRLSGRRQQGIIVGVLVGMVVSAMTFVLSIVSGPAQFLHFAQLMDRFHFSSQESDGQSRLMKLAKAIRNRDKPQNTRLGVVGNKLADRWEARLKGSGFELKYDKRGRFEKFVIDPETLAKNSEVEGLKNATPEETQKYLKENFNVDAKTTQVNGKTKLTIENADLKFRQARKLDRLAFRSANYSKAGAAARTRTITKRQALYSTWHPIKKLDAKLNDKVKDLYAAWRNRKTTDLESGSTEPSDVTPRDSQDTNNDGNPDKPSDSATETSQDANTVRDEINTQTDTPTPKEGGKFSGVADSLKAKVGLTSLIVGVICMAQGMSEHYDQIQYSNVVQPLIRLSMDTISTGGQIMGSTMLGQPLDMQQLGFAAKRFTKDNASWTSAGSVQAMLGEPQTGPDMPSEARVDQDGNPVTEFLNAIPGVSLICGALGSTVGQILSFGVDVVSGGGLLTAVLGQVTSQTVLPLITDGFINAISGSALDVMGAFGPKFGNFGNIGAFYASNDSALAAGGKELSQSDAMEIRVEQAEFDRQDFATKSFASRMFDFTDQRSLAGRFLDNQSPTFSGNLQNVASILPNMGGLLKNIGSIFTGQKAMAATGSYDFGVPKIGFSISEMDDPAYEDPFENATVAARALKNDDTRDKAQKCFGIKISADEPISISPGDSAPSYADLDKYGCNDTSSTWTSIRIFILDSETADAYACIEGIDPVSCSNIGFGGASTTSATTSSTSTPTLPSGDGPALAQKLIDAAHAGKISVDKMDQLTNIAAGKGPCPAVNGGAYQVDSKLLAVLVALSENNTFTISSLHRSCTGSTVGAGTKSRHWQGRAVDISGSRPINGVTMGGSFSNYSPVIQQFINQAKQLLPADCELGVANGTYQSGATAIQSLCTNVFLDTASTTGATGPHVHLGV